LLGIGPDEEVPHIDIAATLLTPVSQAKLAREALPAVAENDVWVGDMTVRLPHREMPVSLVLVAHRDDRGDIAFFSSISRDITERKQVEARLLQADLYDQLTGLPNRVLFLDRLDQALVRADHGHTRIAVMSLNIDRFKLVNDSYGHHAGDSLLVRAASRLSDVLRPGDTAARFGSDTFTVLCEEVTDEEQAGEIAQRFSAALSAPFDLDGDRVFLTVSIGITLSGSGAATAPTMLRDADAAMHLAKERGRARHEIYSESLRTFAVHRLRTGNDLHRALSEGEFRLVYQPEVSLDDGHITAVEALLRWHHPDRGLVPPAEFIPLAEETGLIEPIGLWVLETAAAQAALWRNARHDGGPLPVWVNLSPRQLANPSIVEQVATVLERKAVDPRQIGLEITESALLEDAEAAIRQMTALRSLGIRLAVDDFGTGYASLAYLKRLPIDAVKIDRAFVDGIGNDADDVAIVTAVIGMAKALRLVSIAEGTETREQVRALRDLGCGLAQGYFFTTPQPAQTVTRLLSSDRRGPMFPFDEKTTDAPPTPAPRPAPAEVREVIVPQSRP
jgi:diguanylate cyclase (GGDEF)-like protein